MCACHLMDPIKKFCSDHSVNLMKEVKNRRGSTHGYQCEVSQYRRCSQSQCRYRCRCFCENSSLNLPIKHNIDGAVRLHHATRNRVAPFRGQNGGMKEVCVLKPPEPDVEPKGISELVRINIGPGSQVFGRLSKTLSPRELSKAASCTIVIVGLGAADGGERAGNGKRVVGTDRPETYEILFSSTRHPPERFGQRSLLSLISKGRQPFSSGSRRQR